MEWKDLFLIAKDKILSSNIGDFIGVGNSSCVILSTNNNVYYGVSMTSNSSFSSCAERSACLNMISNGDAYIKRMVILNELEEPMMPCNECIEHLLELSLNYGDIEILTDLKKEKFVLLKDLLPDWFGMYRSEK